MLSTPDFNLLRKPAGIPSTRGQEKSFLDNIKTNVSLSEVEGSAKERQNSISNFTEEQEYGLLNRLDNETQGLLYFAKNQAAYDLYKKLQSDSKITKYYIASVYGYVRPLFGRVSTPIAHHATDKTKMVTVQDDETHYRSKQQYVSTYYEKLYYDKADDITILHIEITKGARHQIRCHLASIGHPIVNDFLYTTKKQRKKLSERGVYQQDGELGLMSVGLRY